MIISKTALRAHNKGFQGASFNEEYNKAYKLGTAKERGLLRRLALDAYGILNGLHTLTFKDIIEAGHSIK